MPLKGEALLECVVRHIELPRDEIILKAGYMDPQGNPEFSGFYSELLQVSLGFPDDRLDEWIPVKAFLQAKGGGCSPMLEGDTIIGRYGIRISSVAEDHDWDEVDWEDIKEEVGEGHLDSPYEVQISTSSQLRWNNHYRLEDACDDFGGAFIDLFRSSYDCLGDDENGQTLNEFLDQYEEHPRHYIELAQVFGWCALELPPA